MVLVLERYIMKAIKEKGFCGSITQGEKGIGKSVYCIKTAFNVYKRLRPELKDMEIYQLVLDNTLFTISDVVKALKTATKKDEPIPCAVWDDCIVHASSQMYFYQMKETIELRSVFETIRTGCSSLLLNCTNSQGLLKFIRLSDNVLVEIHRAREGGYDRIARGYHVFRLPSGKTYFYKDYEDSFNAWLPNAVYQAYYEKRKRYLAEAVGRMDDLIKDGEVSKKYSDKKRQLDRFNIDRAFTGLKKKGVDIENIGSE